MTRQLDGIVAKNLGASTRTVAADFAGGGFGDRDAMKRTLLGDIVCTPRRPGYKPVPDAQRRATDSSTLIF